ncbi:MAG TPA: hypothetical protein PLR06_13660, partial [Cyclobacteriaceae bacterium]|nr:hypothetical protein [Cyclobacteriaceae bacterium]
DLLLCECLVAHVVQRLLSNLFLPWISRIDTDNTSILGWKRGNGHRCPGRWGFAAIRGFYQMQKHFKFIP